MAKQPKQPKKPKFRVPKGELENEFRRLTQFANRRIKEASKAFAKEGMSIAPKAVTGGIQIKEQWFSDKYALSRGVIFESEADYKKQLAFLKSFEKVRPSITEWTKTERTKTLAAVESVLGDDVPEGLAKKIAKMSGPQLSQFWKVFSDKAQKVGVKYNSNAIMMDTLAEFFPEDMKAFDNRVSENIMVEQYKRDMGQL
jgi:hypothetical protein